jgi:RES domain-containing protein
MKVFRIEREKYLSATLSGTGASMSDGFRWNSLNTSIVYTAESRALALLEISVHLDLQHDLPADRYIVGIDIPDELEILELKLEELPFNWDAKPPIFETKLIGDDFVFKKTAPVLKVPSAIIPQEFNYLINPTHPDSSKIRIFSTDPLNFDSRLARSTK